MEGKRTTTLMVIMCLVILSLNVNPATAAECSCCISARAKACCFACITAGGSDSLCKNTCCFPCVLSDSGKFVKLTLFNAFNLLYVHTSFVAYRGLIRTCGLPCTLPISQLQAYYLHHEDILYSIITTKLTHALMGFPYLNLTVAAKMEEMGVLAKMEEGQA